MEERISDSPLHSTPRRGTGIKGGLKASSEGLPLPQHTKMDKKLLLREWKNEKYLNLIDLVTSALPDMSGHSADVYWKLAIHVTPGSTLSSFILAKLLRVRPTEVDDVSGISYFSNVTPTDTKKTLHILIQRLGQKFDTLDWESLSRRSRSHDLDDSEAEVTQSSGSRGALLFFEDFGSWNFNEKLENVLRDLRSAAGDIPIVILIDDTLPDLEVSESSVKELRQGVNEYFENYQVHFVNYDSLDSALSQGVSWLASQSDVIPIINSSSLMDVVDLHIQKYLLSTPLNTSSVTLSSRNLHSLLNSYDQLLDELSEHITNMNENCLDLQSRPIYSDGIRPMTASRDAIDRAPIALSHFRLPILPLSSSIDRPRQVLEYLDIFRCDDPSANHILMRIEGLVNSHLRTCDVCRSRVSCDFIWMKVFELLYTSRLVYAQHLSGDAVVFYPSLPSLSPSYPLLSAFTSFNDFLLSEAAEAEEREREGSGGDWPSDAKGKGSLLPSKRPHEDSEPISPSSLTSKRRRISSRIEDRFQMYLEEARSDAAEFQCRLDSVHEEISNEFEGDDSDNDPYLKLQRNIGEQMAALSSLSALFSTEG